MASFTKGPWVWQSFDGGRTIFLGTPDRGRLVVMDVGRCLGRTVQSFRFAKGGILQALEIGDLQRHPDACLIAASPDLYEALEEVSEELAVLLAKTQPADPREDYSGGPLSLRMARAALRAARGEKE